MIRSVLILLVLMGAGTSQAWALVNISAIPIEGGSSLRLDSLDISRKQVKLRVVSTGGRQYQVFQRVLVPLGGSQGQTFNIQAIDSQSLAGSNTAGTLYMQNAEHLNFSDQLIYSSSPSGESDSFVIGYHILSELANASGNFQGRLAFVVRSADGSESEASVDVSIRSRSNWKAAVQTGSGSRLIHIDSQRPNNLDYIHVLFSGNPGQEVRIYQQWQTWPADESGRAIDPDVLQFNARGNGSGLRMGQAAAAQIGQVLIYSGRDAQNDFAVYLSANPEKIIQQEPGIYSGRLKYTIQAGGNTQEYSIDVQLRVQAVFTIDVTSPTGGLNFGRILPNNPPAEKEVVIAVQSNLGRPYQVMQNFEAPLTNEQGKEFDRRYFVFRVEVPDGQKGRTKFVGFSAVHPGDYPIFSSDATGSPATFKVVYQMQGYAQVSPGTFSAPVMFSLNQN